MNHENSNFDLEEIQAALAARGPFAVLDALGVPFVREMRFARLSCPFHDERTPSATFGVGPEGTLRLHCFGACGRSWDALALVARVEGLDERSDFRRVIELAAGLAGVAPLPPGASPRPRPEPPPPEPPRYAPPDELSALFALTTPVLADPEAHAALLERAIGAGMVDDLGLAFALPPDVAPLPRWARALGLPWPAMGYRLLLPTYAAETGAALRRGVRAWRIHRSGPPGPKRVAPAGCSQAGLFLADLAARRMLGGGAPARFVVVEGEPDFLSMATVSALHARDWGTIGVVAGSWTPGLAALVPPRSVVAVCTHDDTAGDAYAKTIADSAEGRFEVVRRPPPADGEAKADLNDLHMRGGLADFDPFAAAPAAGALPKGDIDFAPGAVEWIRDFAAGRPKQAPMSTGFYDLDALLHGGYREGDLWIVFGRTGMGKTSCLFSTIGGHLLAPSGRGAYLFSVETKHDKAFARAFANRTGIPLARLLGSAPGTEAEVGMLVEAGAALSRKPFRLCDVRLTVEEIAGRVAAFAGGVRAAGGRLGIVAVDYVQRVKKSNPRHDEREHVMHVTAELKEIAMREDLAVVALSQASRRTEDRGDKRPCLADLKESGSLEEDADGVIGVYRPGYYDRNEDQTVAQLLVMKNRHGPTDRVDVRWRPETSSYHDDYAPDGGRLASKRTSEREERWRTRTKRRSTSSTGRCGAWARFTACSCRRRPT